jgi:DNA-binding transcriptional MerR regulator
MDKAPDAFRTISEVADDLDLPQHVLRFWETRFQQIKPMKRGGGRRYYRPDDVDLLRGIRHLLYGEGYTIRGVQRILKDHGVKFVQNVWQAGAPQPARVASDHEGEEPELARPLPGQRQRESEGGERKRLFGLIPSFGSEDDSARVEPAVEAPEADDESDEESETPARAAPAASASQRPAPPVELERRPPPAPAVQPPSLLRDDLRRLQAALHEMNECRRLLDAALEDEPR